MVKLTISRRKLFLLTTVYDCTCTCRDCKSQKAVKIPSCSKSYMYNSKCNNQKLSFYNYISLILFLELHVHANYDPFSAGSCSWGGGGGGTGVLC